MTFIWSLNQFQAIANLKPSQHLLEKKKKEKCTYSLQPDHLKAEQNDRKVKRRKIKQKWVKERERENSKYKRPLPVKIITGPWQNG